MEWDTDQQSMMLSYTAVVDGQCTCGEPLAESTNPANEGRYLVDLPTRCHSCTALAVAAKAYENTDHKHALRFGIQLIK